MYISIEQGERGRDRIDYIEQQGVKESHFGYNRLELGMNEGRRRREKEGHICCFYMEMELII